VKTELVFVETIETFRKRYVVEVPQGKSEWALDTVDMGEAKEFSQRFLGETIVSHRTVTKQEAISLCDRDNDYAAGWTDAHKAYTFFTMMTAKLEPE